MQVIGGLIVDPPLHHLAGLLAYLFVQAFLSTFIYLPSFYSCTFVSLALYLSTLCFALHLDITEFDLDCDP